MRVIQLNPEQLSQKMLTVTEDSYAVWQAQPVPEKDGMLSLTLGKQPSAKTACAFNYTLFDPARGATEVWGLLDDKQLLGMLEVQSRPDGSFRILLLCIFEGFRRRGYGTLLITKARELARRASCERLLITVRAASSGGISFLLTQGFTFAGCDLFAPCPEDPSRTEPTLTFSLSLR